VGFRSRYNAYQERLPKDHVRAPGIIINPGLSQAVGGRLIGYRDGPNLGLTLDTSLANLNLNHLTYLSFNIFYYLGNNGQQNSTNLLVQKFTVE